MRRTKREIAWTSGFKRDFKREKRKDRLLESILDPVLSSLANDKPLADKQVDHALVGNLKDFRDCHIKPDLILIYQKPDEETLLLVRLGSHSELSL